MKVKLNNLVTVEERNRLMSIRRRKRNIYGAMGGGGDQPIPEETFTSADFDGATGFSALPSGLQIAGGGFSVALSVFICNDNTCRMINQGSSTTTNNNTFNIGTNSSSQPSFIVYGGTTTRNINILRTAVAERGRWLRWLFTWDGTLVNTGLEFYENGVLQTVTRANGGSGAPLAVTPYDVIRLGRSFINVASSYGDCRMTEIVLINKTLNQTEATEDYNDGRVFDRMTSSFANNIVAYYRTQGDMNDSSGNNYHGTDTNVKYLEGYPYEIEANQNLYIHAWSQSNLRGNTNGQTIPSYLNGPNGKANIWDGSNWSPLTNSNNEGNTFGVELQSAYDWDTLQTTTKTMDWEKFGIGSTGIGPNGGNDFNRFTGGYYTTQLVPGITRLAARASADPNGKFAMIMIGGEADANDGRTTEEFKTDFTDIKEGLEAIKPYNVIVLGKMSGLVNSVGFNTAGIPAIRTACDELASEDNRIVIHDGQNYRLGTDLIHYTRPANIRQGADVMVKIAKYFGWLRYRRDS